MKKTKKKFFISLFIAALHSDSGKRRENAEIVFGGKVSK